MNFYDFGEVIDIDTEFVIFGIPWDYFTSIISSNSAIAPKKIRDVTENLHLISEMGYEIPKLKAVDIGDVKIEPKSISKNLEEIENFVNDIYNQKKTVVLVMIGGDHFCSYPVIKTVGNFLEKKSKFGILILDAHLDLYNEFDKGLYSHATVSRRVYDLDCIDNKNFLIVGTREIDIPELQTVNEEKITYLNAHLLIDFGLKRYIEKITNFFTHSNIKNLYVSIDIDALDPSIAPGTGLAIPGGFSYREMWQILKELAKNFNIIAFDLVEVAPNLDHTNNMTCILAAKLIIEFMSFIKMNK